MKRLFSGSSTVWRINRELLIGIGGPRAVLMQIAHPLIAAGVAEHSQFSRSRFGRVYRTSAAAAAITFGTRNQALRATAAINQKHQKVHGRLKIGTGVFPPGTPYDANNPELKLWVLSTITDSTLLAYEMFVAPLSEHDREQYYRDSHTLAELFGIPQYLVPQRYEDFRCYLDNMLESGTIRVGDHAREIANALFAPSPGGTALFLLSAAGIGLLPERLRQEFHLSWGPRRERWLRRIAALCRHTRHYLPSVICCSPAATIAEWQDSFSAMKASRL